jgi:hypothetical protein
LKDCNKKYLISGRISLGIFVVGRERPLGALVWGAWGAWDAWGAWVFWVSKANFIQQLNTVEMECAMLLI